MKSRSFTVNVRTLYGCVGVITWVVVTYVLAFRPDVYDYLSDKIQMTIGVIGYISLAAMIYVGATMIRSKLSLTQHETR